MRKFIYLNVMIKIRYIWVVLIAVLTVSCRDNERKLSLNDYYDSEFFRKVQLQSVYPDSKTFVDMIPVIPLDSILYFYREESGKEGFDLKNFVDKYFDQPEIFSTGYVSDTTQTMKEHIFSVWPVLSRTDKNNNDNSSRINLPKSYVVPGGRFQELYYWDSYFTIVGLLLSEKADMAVDMVDNFSYLIDSLGFIPNGTRKYYLSRSQPPFYTLMVNAVSEKDNTLEQKYFPYVLKEYEYWMKGSNDIKQSNTASGCVVNIGDTLFLNRYWDSNKTPRPESYREDHELAEIFKDAAEKEELYGNLRAAAASGWDFSSRWYTEEGEFLSTGTAGFAPVDLNCLMYYMEATIAADYKNSGDTVQYEKYRDLAEKRKNAILTIFWDKEKEFFFDYDFKEKKRSGELTLAAVYPLYFELASTEQAEKVKDRLMADFLKAGGLLTTLKETGQQWDAPNGWAPLQWMAVKGLLNYGYKSEATTIMKQWLEMNSRVYKNTGKMMEKYNVVETDMLSGGGEYALQDGFGWTNGVALGFIALLDELDK